MSVRTFTDSRGIEWTVWQVAPQGLGVDAPDRRSGPRRMESMEHGGMERRRRSRRLGLAPGFEAGWLVFKSRGERRRLAPVPEDWERVDDASLERYCSSAMTVER